VEVVSWRSDLEKRATVTCQYCGVEWLHWDRPARKQKYGACRPCAINLGIEVGATKSAAAKQLRTKRNHISTALQALRTKGATAIRENTAHEETVIGDRAYCRICGPIEGIKPDPVFHADHYIAT
jgi:hypothetical protein